MKIEHDPDAGCRGCPMHEITTGYAHGPHDVYVTASCRALVTGTVPASGPAPAACPLREGYVLIAGPCERPTLEVGNERGAK